MEHVLYVDLSAKVEQWAKDSAIAASNDHCRVYLVTGKAKQKIRALIKSVYGGKSDQYRLLAMLVYLVVKPDLQQLAGIVIDKDYAGAKVEGTIKNLLLDLIRTDKPDISGGQIRFAQVRGSRADRLAKQVYDRTAKPDRILRIQDLEALIHKQ